MIAENWNSQFFHPSHLQRHNKSSGCHHKDTNFNHIDGTTEQITPAIARPDIVFNSIFIPP
ncbi:hypothetical protein EUBVEN_01783 [Eubacterium ventriosum ATCC 27560]|uniref:Uncharacterized protein n=1 Tax=Eubacterium ventriosum ATCC 27560 TaxID=411463 RepID=A5Z7U3_9FIRM|nr:hypothetical protein EUBVEN_01783 [Eubacterium ventriosum ATCC 27560]